jgi:hypothetical protein
MMYLLVGTMSETDAWLRSLTFTLAQILPSLQLLQYVCHTVQSVMEFDLLDLPIAHVQIGMHPQILKSTY